jgi:hypothetical protein
MEEIECPTCQVESFSPHLKEKTKEIEKNKKEEKKGKK